MVRRVVIVVMACGLAGGAFVLAQRPAGQTEVRPGRYQAPEFPPPSIVDYRPKPTLVVAEHPVPKAKYPVIDVHSHQPSPITPEAFDRVVAAMDQLNLKLMVNLSGGSGDRLRKGLDAIAASPHNDRMVLFANVDFRDVGPGFGVKAAQQLEADIKAGAKGLKIFKNLGLRARRADGMRLKLDDPELAPIWETCARLNVPVLIHTADPASFFDPIDSTNERWLELALFSDRRYQDPSFPRFEELAAERDRLFASHQKTRFIVAHMGWHANDLGRLSKMMDRMPNISVEVGAILYDLGRQPRAAHDFFVKYQDRVMFGKDSFQPEEYPYYWRVFETRDEYFDYYRDYHAFWKLYYRNALTTVPGLPKAGFPM